MFRWLKKRSKLKPAKGLRGVDFAELEAAERQLKANGNTCVAELIRCEHVREGYLLELVGYLNSEGIEAVFTPRPLPYPPIGTFVVKVKPSQLKQAKDALVRFQEREQGPR